MTTTENTQLFGRDYGYGGYYGSPDEGLDRGARIAIGVCVSIGGVILIIALMMFANRYCSRPFRPRFNTTNFGSGGPGMPQGYYGPSGQPYQPQAYPMGHTGSYGGYGAPYQGGGGGNGYDQYGNGNGGYAPPEGPPPGHESATQQYAPPEGPPPGHESTGNEASDHVGKDTYAPPEGPPPSHNAPTYAPPASPPPAHKA